MDKRRLPRPAMRPWGMTAVEVQKGMRRRAGSTEAWRWRGRGAAGAAAGEEGGAGEVEGPAGGGGTGEAGGQGQDSPSPWTQRRIGKRG